MDQLPQVTIKEFQDTVWAHYQAHGRSSLPWRVLARDVRQRFYEVIVSEIMLQQTQVRRVAEKYTEWMRVFPTMNHVAAAEFSDVLTVWQGLGYNRRARYLYDALKMIASQTSLPQTEAELIKLPGIGVNTAGAILAYCFNKPAMFIETNIRTVYMYHFPELLHAGKVHDSQIRALLAETADLYNPREWYWALMDYGTYLKRQGFKNHMSAHYTVQSKFEGSLRQLRAQIVREVLSASVQLSDLESKFPDPRFPVALHTLVKDRTIEITGGYVCVAGSSVK